ncbi:hypothetical protein [Rhodoferax sp. GW822-FHT02A01]|jgi:hypothetical protein
MTIKTLLKWVHALTHHYALHRPEPVGMYAASYLERQDWDHK